MPGCCTIAVKKRAEKANRALSLADQSDKVWHSIRALLIGSLKTEEIIHLRKGVEILDTALVCQKLPEDRTKRFDFIFDDPRSNYRVFFQANDNFWGVTEQIRKAKMALATVVIDLESGRDFDRTLIGDLDRYASAFSKLSSFAIDTASI